jgi:dihydrofolate reductase
MILRIGSGPRSDQPKEEEMGRVIVTEFVSLDGVMEAPGGEPGYAHSGWTFDFGDAGQYAYKLDETLEAEALLLGRVTYEGFAAAWPGRTDEAGFADKMNEMPKYVVSSTLDEVNWNTSTLLRGDITEEVPRLKEEIDGVILVAGSRTLVHGLLEHGLVDELRLMIFPVILGSGRRVFPETQDKIPLRLADTRQYDNGIVVHAYEPEKTR